ncbi:MAG TPA: hypothetical protein VFC78_20400 [Tepidisphaeraceae bacterium]|nr:hypothetical protein [Tepidisphaeraceae bacterium]
MTFQEIYDQAVKPLPARERLQLAALILNEIASPSVGVSEEWSEDDLRDFTTSSWRNVEHPTGADR